MTSTGCGTLYLVAVPIGNIGDITYRAVETLRSVDLIAAEDTRDFREIQRAYDIPTRVISYHDHNEQPRSRELLERLLAGESVAVVSDAGTPLINDPGFRIVNAAIEAGVPITSLPGPSAVTTALAAAGLPTASFLYLGYPPRTSSKRRAFFTTHARQPATLVFYEAPHRLAATVADLLETLGDRPACLARNLTKPHERYQRGSLSTLLAELSAEETVRGETTVVVGGASGDEPEDRSGIEEQIAEMLADGVDSRTILDQIMAEHGIKRREAYELILRVRDDG
jgi:16S rRNA (cytidine1402-2'-O)-methyltransferase